MCQEANIHGFSSRGHQPRRRRRHSSVLFLIRLACIDVISSFLRRPTPNFFVMCFPVRTFRCCAPYPVPHPPFTPALRRALTRGGKHALLQPSRPRQG